MVICMPTYTELQQDASPECNIADTARFLRLLDPMATQFEFRCFDDDRDRNAKNLTTTFYGTLTQCAARLQRLNQKGAGVFVVVNETDGVGRETENIRRVRAVYIDLDGAPLEPVLASRFNPHIIVESSPKRWHCYWRTTGMALDDFKPVQEALIDLFDSDKSITALAGVMRLPGFHHRKAERFLVRISDTHDAPAYPASYFKRSKRPIRKPVDGDIEVNVDKVVAALDASTNDDVDERTWFKIMAAAWRGSDGDEEAFKAFMRWSSKSPKHRDKRTRQRWRSFGRRPPCSIGPGSLYAHADATAPGWREAMVRDAAAELAKQYAADVAASIAKAGCSHAG
jgi:Primase C terminal 2 (PriCT-2)/RepB DNA-primase from phage plasmid